MIDSIIITDNATITNYSDSGLVLHEPNTDCIVVGETVQQILIGRAANELVEQWNEIVFTSTDAGSMFVDLDLFDILLQNLGYNGNFDPDLNLKITFCKSRGGASFLQFEWRNEDENSDQRRFAWLAPLGQSISGPIKSHSALNAANGEDV
ncbi:hypothetical protein [Herpetosiphon sp. NSE202]|uniref:hypothetical protein n=1 Tax=Herpetosiphon sp. NSE202 TaxID=3351349 RepID=UPI0036386A82